MSDTDLFGVGITDADAICGSELVVNGRLLGTCEKPRGHIGHACDKGVWEHPTFTRWRRERDEAQRERDALRAQLDAIRALCGKWDGGPGSQIPVVSLRVFLEARREGQQQ